VRYNAAALPVCITGMHRSGTSLVASVLHECGLDFGDDASMNAGEDNRQAFEENTDFSAVSDALLSAFGGAWDRPPELRDGWEELEELEPLRLRAAELVARFENASVWGWSDPCSALTLPFWRQVVRDLTVVGCVRNPIEVAESLETRNGFTHADAFRLWLTYNRRLLKAAPLPELEVVNYDWFFDGAEDTVRELADTVGLTPSEGEVARAALRVTDLVGHHDPCRAETERLPAEVAQLYAKLSTAAADPSRAARNSVRARGARAASRENPMPSPTEEETLKYTKLDDSPGSAHMLVVELVPEGARVLDVGCATGYLAEAIAQRRSSRVTGIEVSPMAAERAREHCERVIVGDVETLDLEAELGEERFDVVIFADVLEHLRDPGQILGHIRPFVADGGSVVASIPNIAHGSVRLALLGGEFRYRAQGLLDDTHLRFFTREGIQDLFEEAGFLVAHWRRRRIDVRDAEIEVPGAVPKEAQAWVASDPDASTYQFVVRAVPSDAAHQLKALRERLKLLQDALAPLKQELDATREELDATREELVSLRRAYEHLQRRLIAERTAFGDHVHELRRLFEPRKRELLKLTEELAWRKEAMEQQQEEIEWRKGVMEDQAARISRVEASRLFRYTRPARRVVARLRGRT
jgi:2-polyprenyl-3-methyl-5-hydroxy-6-metoxy-1,4-benzoquinol methylase